VAVYTYASNVAANSGTTAIDFERVDGSKVEFRLGTAMDLTTDEVALLSQFINLSPGGMQVAPAVLASSPVFSFPPQMWSAYQAWPKRSIVYWLGSTFVAVNDVPSGGTNPWQDAANWFVLARGGGEIARAEQTSGQNFLNATASSWTDCTGLQIVVPAGSPAFLLEAFLPALAVNGGATNVAGDTYNVGLHIRDEVGTAVGQGHFQVQMSAANKIEMFPIAARRIMPASTADHTYRASVYWSPSRAGVGSLTAYNGPGTNTGVPTTDSGPAWIAATAR
jgi:hypothetical protein